ncbi:MAG: hypothetical protein KF886_23440 [Candidatus Hydrogenedentes bacterium]|nr:hypothetical protein [Candidatus Hydrogenedentota bacterium]
MVQLRGDEYADSGRDIQWAMVDQVKRYPDKSKRPDHILWNGRVVKTYDRIPVAESGLIRAEFLSVKPEFEQGFDLKVYDGWLELEKGERVDILRTWKDNRYEDSVEYPFFCRKGEIGVWNVFKRMYGNDRVVEEKWTGNAGFWVEELSESERIYHCSHGMADPPDFEALVFKVSIFR